MLSFQLCVVRKGLVLQYQLHNRVENLVDVSTRCSGLLFQGEDLCSTQQMCTSSMNHMNASAIIALQSDKSMYSTAPDPSPMWGGSSESSWKFIRDNC